MWTFFVRKWKFYEAAALDLYDQNQNIYMNCGKKANVVIIDGNDSRFYYCVVMVADLDSAVVQKNQARWIHGYVQWTDSPNVLRMVMNKMLADMNHRSIMVFLEQNQSLEPYQRD